MPGTPWTAHTDDEGRTYYYSGDVTSWDKPQWTAYKHTGGAADGGVYYSNETTGESVWEVPDEDYLDVQEEEEENDENDTAKAPETNDDGEAVATSNEDEEQTGDTTAPDEKEEEDPTTKKEDTKGGTKVDASENVGGNSDDEPNDQPDPSDDALSDDVEDEGPSSPPVPAASPGEQEDNDEDLFHQSPAQLNNNDDDDHDDDDDEENDIAYDWSAFQDDEGRIYYYNDKTGQSAWDPPPEGFNPPPPPPADKENTTAATNDDTTVAQAVAASANWQVYTDEEGRTYYYNENTDETQWEMPEGFQDDTSFANVAAPMDTSSDVAKQSSTRPSSPYVVDAPADVEMEPAATTVPEIDPAVKRLQEAESMLGRLDSVLEPDCISHADVVVGANDGDPQKAMSALITNYRGQTAICGLLGKWLTDLKRPADSVRDVCREVIVKTVKDSFSKDLADDILKLSKSKAAFLGGMIDSPEWRKVLIDLTVKHKDSAVLLYCLRGISERGHHREIAQSIDQSEHFAVFNAMLASELSVVGSQAVSAGSDVTSAIQLRSLVADLCRSCTSTAYTYMYSIALLRALDRMARDAIAEVESSSDGAAGSVRRDERFRQAAEKWRALAEELEAVMTDPTQTQSSSSSSHLPRKRRLDVALSFGDLRERHNKKPNTGETDQPTDLNRALASLISRYSMGIQLEESMLDNLLPQGLNIDPRGIGELMNRYPLSIKALLGQLYKPGATRLASPSMKSKCARLIALATEAATHSAFEFEATKKGSLNEEGELPSDELGEVSLMRMIVDGSKYCEALETTVAFYVFSGCTKDHKGNLSDGQKLYELSLKCSPVALGVMMWAKDHTRGRDFSSSASFPTISSSILSLVRLIAISRPATRRDALDVAVTFLEQSNSDISYKKITSIRENALRLMIVLLTKGEVVAVLATMIKRMEDRSRSDIDASLIRYFVFGIVDVVRGPVSPVMVRLLTQLLSVPKVSDAVRSSYVTKENAQRLRNLISLFPATIKRCGEKAIFPDAKQFSSLAKLYGISE